MSAVTQITFFLNWKSRPNISSIKFGPVAMHEFNEMPWKYHTETSNCGRRFVVSLDYFIAAWCPRRFPPY
jgi:hypothetical protein